MQRLTATSETANQLVKGVSEMRIHYGPGYRVYFSRIGSTIYLLLAGGDKTTQKRDIARALEMARQLKG